MSHPTVQLRGGTFTQAAVSYPTALLRRTLTQATVSTQTTEMHILAVIMLHQNKFCVYKGKRKLKLLITCGNFVLFVL